MHWTIDKRDIVLLAAYLGGDMLIGVDDPYLGWLAEQVEAQWPKTKQSLLQAGVASLDEDGELSVYPEMKEAIDLCCHPKRFLSIGIYGRQKSKTTVNIGEGKYAIVEEFENSVDLSTREYSAEELSAFLSEKLRLPPAANRFLERSITSESAAVASFPQEPAGKESADSMVSDMLANPDSKALIVLGDYSRGGTGIRTFGIYVKAERILRLDETGSGSLTMRSVTANDVLTDMMKV